MVAPDDGKPDEMSQRRSGPLLGECYVAHQPSQRRSNFEVEQIWCQ